MEFTRWEKKKGILLSGSLWNKLRALKRSHSGRSLCSVLHFQSFVPLSVFVHLSTRSLSSFGSFPLKKTFLCSLPSVARFYRIFFNFMPSFLAGANVIKIKNPIIVFAHFVCIFLFVVFAVSRYKLLRAVVPLCTLAPCVFIPTATPPPVHYFIPLSLHFGRSLGGCIW